MEIFGDLYSKYYDEMYSNKDYDLETACVEFWLKKYGQGSIKNIISLGAGTLNYEERLTKKGYNIHGIELSPGMVKLAQNKIAEKGLGNQIVVEQGDMMQLPAQKKQFDAALAMFNVVGYCADLQDFEKVVKNINKNLRPDGLFMFDAWYAPAVLKDGPQDRWKKIIKGECQLYRLLNSVHQPEKKSVLLKFELLEICNQVLTARQSEQHPVSYWNLEEIEKVLNDNSFKLAATCNFPYFDKPITDQSWYMGVVAKKIK